MAKIKRAHYLQYLVKRSDAFRVVFHQPMPVEGEPRKFTVKLSLEGRIGDGYVGNKEKWQTLVSVTLSHSYANAYGRQFQMVDPAEALFERITGVDRSEYMHFWA